MGDEILMRILILSATITCLMLANPVDQNSTNAVAPVLQNTEKSIFELDPSIQRYENMFKEINTPRVGLNDQNKTNVKDPFMIQKAPTVVSDNDGKEGAEEATEALVLRAIFNNKVKIGNNWYKRGDEIGDYKLIMIKRSSVILTNKDEKLELNITQGKNNVGIKIK